MVSFTVYRANSGGAYVEGVCLATDEKPVAGITNGSILFAVDTTDGSLTRYMFDQNSATWIETECPCSCDGGGEGGGGEGGGDSTFVVNSVELGDGLFQLTATWNEIKAASDANKRIVLQSKYEDDGFVSWQEIPISSFGADLGEDPPYVVRFGSDSVWTSTSPDSPLEQSGGR